MHELLMLQIEGGIKRLSKGLGGLRNKHNMFSLISIENNHSLVIITILFYYTCDAFVTLFLQS